MKSSNSQNFTVESSDSKDYFKFFCGIFEVYKKSDFIKLDTILGLNSSLNNIMTIRKLEIIKYSLKAGIGVDISIKDEHGVTLLHLAAATGQTEVVQCLIESGANINAEDIYRNTPIHHAAHRGNLEVVK